MFMNLVFVSPTSSVWQVSSRSSVEVFSHSNLSGWLHPSSRIWIELWVHCDIGLFILRIKSLTLILDQSTRCVGEQSTNALHQQYVCRNLHIPGGTHPVGWCCLCFFGRFWWWLSVLEILRLNSLICFSTSSRTWSSQSRHTSSWYYVGTFLFGQHGQHYLSYGFRSWSSALWHRP